MPRAADAAIDHKPFGQRPVVVAAMGGDGEYLVGAVRQQDLLVAHVSAEFAVDKVREPNSLGQIRPAGARLLLCHVFLLGYALPILRRRRRAENLDGAVMGAARAGTLTAKGPGFLPGLPHFSPSLTLPPLAGEGRVEAS